MNQTKVIIADTDVEYAKALAKALAARAQEFTVMLDFTLLGGENNLSRKLELEEGTLLLVDMKSKEHLAGTCNDSQQIVGLLPVGREGRKQAGFINKYIGLTGILEDLWMLSGRKLIHEESLPLSSTCRFIGITGGAGGTGKTSIAIALGRELRLMNEVSTLYISFENANATEHYFPSFGGEKSLNDLLYYLHTDGVSHVAGHMNAFLIKDASGLETFRPPNSINEIADAKVEIVHKLLEQVLRWKEYAYIILDFQLEATRRCHWLLSCCNRIIAVEDGTFAAARKTKLLLDHWQQRVATAHDKSVLFVQNKWLGDHEEIIGNDRNHLYIEFDPESFHRYEDRMEIELDRRFGMGVKRIAASIRNEY